MGTFAGACRSRGRREAGGGDLDDDGPRQGEDGDVDGVQDTSEVEAKRVGDMLFDCAVNVVCGEDLKL